MTWATKACIIYKMPRAKKKPAKQTPKKSFPLLETLLVILTVGIFIAIRSIHFTSYLNFSNDQGLFATEALKMYQAKKPTLVGPPVSMSLDGRQIFQGPLTYYEFLFFLILGNFDPVASSYFFMLFAALMVAPLYYGSKMLFGRRSAMILTLVYTLFPFYIDFSRFLWNPTFQFALLPLLLLLMGFFKKIKNNWIFLGLSILLGALLQYHYQFALVIAALLIYYIFFTKIDRKQILLYFIGIGIGFSPVILFELRNQFYNTTTALLFLQKYSEIKFVGGGKDHYYLSLSFLLLTALLALIHKKLNKLPEKVFNTTFIIVFVGLLVWSLTVYGKKPDAAFWAPAKNWNYEVEQKQYEIIKKENLKKYNVANIAYDNNSVVVKYLLKKDGIDIDYGDYAYNKYLFIAARKNLEYYFMDDPAYAIQIMRPYKVLKTWELNHSYNLYLIERGDKKSE